MIDVGGTTTDISLVVDGRPVVSSLGSRIGKYHTHVDSVEMVTVGIGGDSLVRIEETGQMEIGPNRVKPLALAPEAAEARSLQTARWVVATREDTVRSFGDRLDPYVVTHDGSLGAPH